MVYIALCVVSSFYISPARFGRWEDRKTRKETCTNLCRAKNMLRKWNYKEYYHAGLSVKEKEHLGSHVGP